MMGYTEILKQLEEGRNRHKLFQGILGDYYAEYILRIVQPNDSKWLS